MNPMNILYGFLLALAVALAAYRLNSLNKSGMLAALVMGTIVFGFGGLPWAVLLLTFFITSSLLSKLFKSRKRKQVSANAKGSQRDQWQVLANGGVSTFFVLLHLLLPESILPWIGFAGALAAANADTWATELGVLSPTMPRLITNGKVVETGTSGGISLAGTVFSLMGSLLIAALAALPWQALSPLPAASPALIVLSVSLAGLAGSLVDSVLGATIQAIFYCPHCDKETEKSPVHSCGTATRHVRGWLWLNNDWVNLACTLTGAIIALLLFQLG